MGRCRAGRGAPEPGEGRSPQRGRHHRRLAGGLALAAAALVELPAGSASELTTGTTATAPEAPSAPEAPTVRALRFPVDGPVAYRDDYGEPRSGGRTHRGNDLVGTKLQPLLAAADGTVTWLNDDDGLSGNALAITDAEGWVYWYLHINNDTPGTDDGANPPEWAFAPGVALEARVLAGQVVAYLGDSGNAEGTSPHLHFELHPPDEAAVSPYASLRVAQGFPVPPTTRPVATTAPAATTPGTVRPTTTRAPTTATTRPATVRPVSAAPLPTPRTVAQVATASARAVATHPRGGFYVLGGDGTVHAHDGAPSYGSPRFARDLARDLAVTPDGAGYVVLDAWGGLHRFGSARTGSLARLSGPYWPGQDRARALVLTPTGRGYAVLEASGAVASYGDAPTGRAAMWPGLDLARDLAFSPSGEGTYLLDAWGAVHVAGDAVRRPGAYFAGLDVARRLVVTPTNRGHAVLDAWGALHVTGDATRQVGGSYRIGSSWRGLALRSGSYLAVRSDGLTESRPVDPRALLSAVPDGEPAPEPPTGD